MGLFSGAFSGLSDVQRQEIITDILGENGRILSLSLEPFDRLQIRQQQIDKEILSVYTTYSDRDNEPRISGFINSKTAILERIDFKFTDNHSHISMTEKIIKRNSQPTIAAKTFTFSPSKGIEKVKLLQVGPFKF
jgi:hypothetical protein